MKKCLLTTLILISIASCKNRQINEAEIIGKWKLVNMESQTDLNPLIELEGKRAFINNYIIIFLDSSDVIIHQTAIDTSTKWGQWKLENNNISIYNFENELQKKYEIKKVKTDRLILKHNIFKDEYVIEEYERMEFE